MRDCSIKFLNSLVTDNTTKKELEIIKFIKKCVNECCDKQENHKEDSRVVDIFNFWNSKNIIKHQELTEKTKQIIHKTLKTYSQDQIKSYIERYNMVIKDKNYFFKYKWTLTDFLSRKDGISAFMDDGSKWVNYNAKKTINSNTNFTQRDYTQEELDGVYDNLDEVDL
jgi:hypothetical protein